MAFQGLRSGEVNDLVLLPANHNGEREIVNCLKKKLAADEIYTYVGETLISVNPYKKVPSGCIECPIGP